MCSCNKPALGGLWSRRLRQARCQRERFEQVVRGFEQALPSEEGRYLMASFGLSCSAFRPELLRADGLQNSHHVMPSLVRDFNSPGDIYQLQTQELSCLSGSWVRAEYCMISGIPTLLMPYGTDWDGTWKTSPIFPPDSIRIGGGANLAMLVE